MTEGIWAAAVPLETWQPGPAPAAATGEGRVLCKGQHGGTGTAGYSHHHASARRPLCNRVGGFCTARGFKNMLLFPLKGSRVHSNPAD